MTTQRIALPNEVTAFLEREKEHFGHVSGLWIAGSLSYGTNLPGGGDIDVRGFTMGNPSSMLGLKKFEQIADTQTDTTIYNFDKYIAMMLSNNPNIIESLGILPEHILVQTSVFREILDNSDRFVSKRLSYTLGGYARAQLHRLTHQREREYAAIREKVDFERVLESRENGDIVVRVFNESGKYDDNIQVQLVTPLNGLTLSEIKDLANKMDTLRATFKQENHRNRKPNWSKLHKHAMHLIRLYYMGIEAFKTGLITTYRKKERDVLLAIRKAEYFNENTLDYTPAFYKLVSDLDKEFTDAVRNTKLRSDPDCEWVDAFMVRVKKEYIECM